MADTTTSVLGLVKPEVGGSTDTWGDKLNADLDRIDSEIAGAFTNIASATTASLASTTTRHINITGAVTITSFGSMAAGVERVLKFASTPTLTYSANLLLLNGKSRTMLAGDTMTIVSEGSGVWREVSGGRAIDITFGQCKLTLSAGSLKLIPFNGNLLSFNGVPCKIPSAGVTLAATGLTVGNLYYIYAVQTNGQVSSLEATATAYAVDTNTGQVIKTGDATRVLVGMVRIVTGPAFADSQSQRFVRSWYNGGPIHLENKFAANRSTTSTTGAEFNSEIRCEFLSWSGELIDVLCNCYNVGSAGGNSMSVYAFLDSGAVIPQAATLHSSVTTLQDGTTGWKYTQASEGYHFVSMGGLIAAGTLTVHANSNISVTLG